MRPNPFSTIPVHITASIVAQDSLSYHEAGNCCSFLCPFRLRFHVCFQFLKAKFSSRKTLGLRQPDCSFRMMMGQGGGRLLRTFIRRKDLQGRHSLHSQDTWQPQAGQKNSFELPDHISGFCKAAVASLCSTNVPAWVCGGGVNIF